MALLGAVNAHPVERAQLGLLLAQTLNFFVVLLQIISALVAMGRLHSDDKRVRRGGCDDEWQCELPGPADARGSRARSRGICAVGSRTTRPAPVQAEPPPARGASRTCRRPTYTRRRQVTQARACADSRANLHTWTTRTSSSCSHDSICATVHPKDSCSGARPPLHMDCAILFTKEQASSKIASICTSRDARVKAAQRRGDVGAGRRCAPAFDARPRRWPAAPGRPSRWFHPSALTARHTLGSALFVVNELDGAASRVRTPPTWLRTAGHGARPSSSQASAAHPRGMSSRTAHSQGAHAS